VPKRTPLTDEKGYISVRSLTCAQLAATFQEDADFLGVWYSGWFNGRNKGHVINVGRTKEGIHQAIVYCKAIRRRRLRKRSKRYCEENSELFPLNARFQTRVAMTR
jgi:hypothetical protein